MGKIEDALLKHLPREDMMDIIGTSVSDEKLAEWIEGEFTPTELFKILTADHGLFKVARIITEEDLWP